MTNDVVPVGPSAASDLAVVADPPIGSNAYWRDPAAQQRHLDRERARQSGAAPPAPPSKADAEIARLTELMRSDRARYERSGSDEKLLALLREKESGTAATTQSQAGEEWRVPAAEARKQLSADVVADLDRAPGGFDAALTRQQDNGRTILENSGDERTDFFGAWRGLATPIQSAVLKELARGPMTFAPLPAPEKFAAFAESEAGAALTEAWGASARAKCGVAMARWERIMAPLTPAQRESWAYFFDHSAPLEQAAVLWQLAEGK
jgi:hypothetical protein